MTSYRRFEDAFENFNLIPSAFETTGFVSILDIMLRGCDTRRAGVALGGVLASSDGGVSRGRVDFIMVR